MTTSESAGEGQPQDLNKTIMNLIQTPFNVHVLNIVNTLQSLDRPNQKKDLDTTHDFFKVDKHIIGNIIASLKEIKLNEKLYESISFSNIVKDIEAVLKQSLDSQTQKVPSQVSTTLASLTKVLNSFSQKNSEALDTSIEELEDNLDAMENEDIKRDLLKSFSNKNTAEKLWKALVDLSSSLYGLLAALSIDSKWKDIVTDLDKFRKTVSQIDTQFFTNDDAAGERS